MLTNKRFSTRYAITEIKIYEIEMFKIKEHCKNISKI